MSFAPAFATSPAMTEKPSAALRLATYNTSLYSDETGGLIKELEGDSEHARKIAAVLQQALGGRIAISSKPGQGSTFAFVLPERELEATS